MKGVNDAVRFVLELCAIAAIAHWGWRAGDSTASRLLLAVVPVLVLATVWAVFRADEQAVVSVPTAVRIVIEVGVFAAATVALVAVGRTGLALAFGVLAAINEILNYTLD